MNTTSNERASKVTDGVVSLLQTHGKTWARYGLTVGRLALETQSQTLRALAGTLGTLADRLANEGDVSAPLSQDASVATGSPKA